MTKLDHKKVTSSFLSQSYKISNTLKGNAHKQTITLNSTQRQVLVGTLLGDASIPLYFVGEANPGPRMAKPQLFCVKFEQNIASADYIHHLYDIFADNAFTSTGYSCWWRWRLRTAFSGSTIYMLSNF